jgi:hypothetical protein
VPSETHQFRDAQLKQLIRLLFRELQAFGIFASVGEADKVQVKEYLQTRATIIDFIVKSLEIGYEELGLNLTVDEETRPVLFNWSCWPENAPIAGYSNVNDKIKYSHLLMTYTGNWHFENEHDQPRDQRLLLASLWIWQKSDFKSALKYLFDLQKYGYLLKGFKCLLLVHLLLRTGRLTLLQLLIRLFRGLLALYRWSRLRGTRGKL